MMRNRSPAVGGAASQPARTIRSPIQGNRGKGKFHGTPSMNTLLQSRAFLGVNALVLLGLLFYMTSGGSSTANTVDLAAAGGNQQNENQNQNKMRRAQQNQNIPKQNANGKVLDEEGDVVEDDMLRKDILAGHMVDAKRPEEEETDIAPEANRWDESTTIPPWLKEYFKWHASVTKKLTEENWRDYKYLVMTCLGGQVCGNVSHRLRPLMAMLRMAHDSKRILMIHWDQPDRLDDYLHPPQHGGIDWKVPQFIMWKVRKSPIATVIPVIHKQAMQEDRRAVNVMYNDDSFAEPYYNDRREQGEVPASQAFKDVWNVFFKPSFMLTERLKETLDLMGLKEGEYAAAHIDYEMEPADDVEEQELRLKVEQAMNCLSGLRPGGPYFVAAQTYYIAREALTYGKQHNVNVQAKQIAHDTSTIPKDLYTSFVEIMLMAGARCVAFNRGGYGQLGYLLGYDYNCRIKYSQTEEECTWKDPPPPTQEQDGAKEIAHKEAEDAQEIKDAKEEKPKAETA